MRKKNWTVTLVALLGFQAGGAVVSAKDYVVDETDIKITYAVNTTDLIARVKKVETVYLSKRQSVEIPKTLKYKSGSKTYNLTVTKIGDNAFEHIDYKTIKLPNTITHIGKRAFAYTSSPDRHIYRAVCFLGRSNHVSVISGIRRTAVDRGRRLLRCGSQGSVLAGQTCKSWGKVFLYVWES